MAVCTFGGLVSDDPRGLPVADVSRVDPLVRRLARPRGLRPVVPLTVMLALLLVAASALEWSVVPPLILMVGAGVLLSAVESINRTTLRLDGAELVKSSGPLRLPKQIVPHLRWRASRDALLSVDISAEPIHGHVVTLALKDGGRLLVDEHHRDAAAARRDAELLADWLGLPVVQHEGSAPRAVGDG